MEDGATNSYVECNELLDGLNVIHLDVLSFADNKRKSNETADLPISSSAYQRASGAAEV